MHVWFQLRTHIPAKLTVLLTDVALAIVFFVLAAFTLLLPVRLACSRAL